MNCMTHDAIICLIKELLRSRPSFFYVITKTEMKKFDTMRGKKGIHELIFRHV